MRNARLGVTWLPFGPIASYTLGNGQTVTRTYDANERVTDIASPAFTLHLARDAMGNVSAIGAAHGANPASESYSYDPLYRINAVTEADGSTLESYTYNPTGDRLSKTASGLATGAYLYNSGTHQLKSTGNAARTSDANGNTTASVVGGNTYGFGYNGRNRLTVAQLNGQTVGTYTYNAMGQRIGKVTSTAERYAYNENRQLIAEYGATNRDYIWLGSLPVAVVDNTITGSVTTSTVSYVTADQLNTPRAISDSSGTTIWQWSYAGNPFGEQQPTSPTGYVFNLRFAGQYYDAESSLVHNDHRDYCTACGRYIQSDPIGLAGGINTFTYGLNNPLRYTDPMGLWVCNGSPAQCSSFSNGLQSVLDASTSGNLEPYQQATLSNIVNAYGPEGYPSVQVAFHGENSTTGGWTGKDAKTRCETVLFNDINLNNDSSHNSKQRWAVSVAHEGQHIVDDVEGDNGFPVSRADTEVNAYTAQAYFQQAIRFSESSGDVWTRSGGINYSNIQTRAFFSINYGK